MKILRKIWYAALKEQDVRLGGWSCHAMKMRGYSNRPIHPKHLFDEERTHYLSALLKPGIAFLDIGSGVGTECKLASENQAKIVCGVEYDWNSLITAVRRTETEENKVSFLRLDLESGTLPFQDNSFDLVNFTNVLEHIHARKAILREVKRIKKDDGVMVLSIPNAGTSWKKKLQRAGLDPRDDDDHKIEYSMDSIEEELASAGLNIISDFAPIIPSFPWNGIIAMSAFVYPGLYKWLQKKKKDFVKKHPKESTGWIFTVI